MGEVNVEWIRNIYRHRVPELAVLHIPDVCITGYFAMRTDEKFGVSDERFYIGKQDLQDSLLAFKAEGRVVNAKLDEDIVKKITEQGRIINEVNKRAIEVNRRFCNYLETMVEFIQAGGLIK